MLKNASLAVIVPCYNEEKCIADFNKEIKQYFANLAAEQLPINVKFIIVNNNSNDGSARLLAEMQSQSPDNIEIIQCHVQGYGAALKQGFKRAVQLDSFGYLAFLDLDNTYPLESLNEMLKQVVGRNLDIIYGARIHHTSDISRVRKFGNLVYVYMLKFLVGSTISDACSGMRLFRIEKTPSLLELSANDLSFSIEFTLEVIQKKWKWAEYKIDYRDRLGESKLSLFKDGFLFLWMILKKSFFRN